MKKQQYNQYGNKRKPKNETKEDPIIVYGKVTETLSDGKFKVLLEETNSEILAYISGKMRIRHIRILIGDRVQIELSQYDLNNGRIIFRYK